MNKNNRYVAEWENYRVIAIQLTDSELQLCRDIAEGMAQDKNNVWKNRNMAYEQSYVGKKGEVAAHKWCREDITNVQGLLNGNYVWKTDLIHCGRKIEVKSKSQEMENKFGTSFFVQNDIDRRDNNLLDYKLASDRHIACFTERDENTMVLRAFFPATILLDCKLYHDDEVPGKKVFFLRELMETLQTDDMLKFNISSQNIIPDYHDLQPANVLSRNTSIDFKAKNDNIQRWKNMLDDIILEKEKH